MKWYNFSDKFPPIGQTIVVYKHKDMGGFSKGYYIAMMITAYYFENQRCEFVVIKDSADQNQNNYRMIDEFEKWMPLDNQPERSKREDSHSCEMRCSEHCGNTVRGK